MDVDQLRAFLAVIEHGSFQRASQALRVSQSTVSFHIKGLEESAGQRLLDRLRQGVRPTAAGRLVQKYATRILGLRSEVLDRLRAETTGQAGSLTVAASTIPGEYLLPRALGELRRTHPGVKIRVDVSDSRRALAALCAQECDLALVGSRSPDRRIAFSPFAEDQIVLVGRGARDGGPALPDLAPGARALRGVPLVLRREGSGTGAAVAGLLARHLGGDEPLVRVEVDSTEAARRFAVEGLGFTFISRLAAADALRAGELRIVRLAGTPVHRRFHVARLRGAGLPPAATALVRILGDLPG